MPRCLAAHEAIRDHDFDLANRVGGILKSKTPVKMIGNARDVRFSYLCVELSHVSGSVCLNGVIKRGRI